MGVSGAEDLPDSAMTEPDAGRAKVAAHSALQLNRAAADLRRVEVLGRRVGRVHVQEVDLDAAQRRVVRHAVLPAHVAGVQDRLVKRSVSFREGCCCSSLTVTHLWL